jgi:hypothetical protein
MSFSTIESDNASAKTVRVDAESITIELTDGRTLSAPIGWYPRLTHATPAELNNWRLIGGGRGVHWPDLDEDISVENILGGRPSGESQASFKKWLGSRQTKDAR